MKKTLLSLAMCLGIATSACAGEPQQYGIFNHLGAGVGVGLTGIDIEVGSCCTEWLQMRAGVTVFPISSVTGISSNMKFADDTQWQKVKNYVGDQSLVKPEKVNLDADLNMTNFKFLVDFYPFHKSSFHITTGFFIGKSRLIDVTGSSDQPKSMQAIYRYNQTQTEEKQIGVEFGDSKIGPDQNGNVEGYVKINSFKPYLGIGFGRIVPKKTRVAFSMDMGVMFWGSPQVCSKNTNGDEIDLLSNSSSDGKDIANIVSKISVYPVLNFRITGRIF